MRSAICVHWRIPPRGGSTSVTRDEFDATQRMLLAARQQIDTLEAQVRELQARLDNGSQSAPSSPEDAWR
jgi:Protein of unknown function (DUF526).